MKHHDPLAEYDLTRFVAWILRNDPCEGCGGKGYLDQEPQTGGSYHDLKPTCPDCENGRAEEWKRAELGDRLHDARREATLTGEPPSFVRLD